MYCHFKSHIQRNSFDIHSTQTRQWSEDLSRDQTRVAQFTKKRRSQEEEERKKRGRMVGQREGQKERGRGQVAIRKT